LTIRGDMLQGVRAWLKGLLSLSDAQVLLGQQTGARPAADYITVTPLSLRRYGTDHTAWSEITEPADPDLPEGPTVTLDATAQTVAYIGTVSVQAFGNTAVGWLETAVNDIDSQASLYLQATSGYDIVDLGETVNDNAVLDTGWVQRVGHDFEVRFRHTGAARATLAAAHIAVDLDADDLVSSIVVPPFPDPEPEPEAP
jgi:hypothetical protein